MFALVTTDQHNNQIVYGPFNTREGLCKYAKAHGFDNNYLVIRLNDCGKAMDY